MRKKKTNIFHRTPIDSEKKQRNEDSRILGTKYFGYPNDPVKVKVSQAVRFFDELLDSEISYDDFERQDLEAMMRDYPFVRHMIRDNITPPPEPPETLAVGELETYLRASREYRLLHPTLDRATKKDASNPCRDSTYVKFELGINTSGCLHVGAGRVIGSSVPLAARRIDWMQRSEIFEEREIPERMIVSDAAIPSEDGLGCGEYPGLVNWIADMSKKEVDGQLMPIIAKFSISDLPKLTERGVHYTCLYKPRRHNLEVIISINIPSVGLDYSSILTDIRDVNTWRNQCCYDADIPYDESEVSIDEALLCDDKDYDLVLDQIGVDITSPRCAYGEAKIVQHDNNPDQLETLIQSGFFEYSDSINKITLQKAHAAMEAHDKRLEQGDDSYTPSPRLIDAVAAEIDDRHFKMREYRRIKGKYMAKCYPIAMWVDIFPHMRMRQLASLIQVIDFIRKEILEMTQKNRRVTWDEMRRQCGKAKKK